MPLGIMDIRNRLLALAAALLALSCAAQTDAEDRSATEEPSAMSEAAPENHPGAAAYPAALRQRLAAATAAKGPDYQPRTHHLAADGRPKYTNRLILEDSPYLVQHAHNPVDWYPWGPEAFERAKREDKPIFLSIGYSTCHWCHVMERESFESEEIARLLNQSFVAVKIDRERRPDIDEIYMTAVQLQRQRGGWPMSSFLTPDGKPFFGGTYFPPQQFAALLERVDEAWGGQRAELVASAERIAAAVDQVTAARGTAREVGKEALELAAREILGRHDPRLGGFGDAPKFPHEPELLLLLDRSLRRGDEEALAAATKSLEAMARGGIYDQVGGGFHRYSTDGQWLVPHFEKMLYNQAHLTRAYLAANLLTGDPFFARVARETLDYVRREMTAPAGGFYSATDADSEGEEGAFFVWTPAELREALPPRDAELAIDLWGVSDGGNFEGKNILHLPRAFDAYAAAKGMPLGELLERVDRLRETLWQVREKREHPLRDDKIVSAWNGMMITAFAEGAEILDDSRYLDAARRAAEFLWAENRRDSGELWRIHLDGSSSIPALLNDYAHLAEASIAFYDATGEAVWLERAEEVAEAMLERFWDREHGGFFMSDPSADAHLIARPKSPTDGAIPSGNSVAVRALAQLSARTGGRRTGEAAYRDRASAALAAFADSLERHPSGHAYMLTGLDELLHGGAGRRQYGGRGVVRASAGLERDDGSLRLAVDLEIGDGWHVNAHRPLSDELIATELSVGEGRGEWSLRAVDYPAGERVRLGFQAEPLRVYQGRVRLAADLEGTAASSAGPVVSVRLRFQACDDKVCLRPEEMVLEVPAAGAMRERGR